MDKRSKSYKDWSNYRQSFFSTEALQKTQIGLTSDDSGYVHYFYHDLVPARERSKKSHPKETARDTGRPRAMPKGDAVLGRPS